MGTTSGSNIYPNRLSMEGWWCVKCALIYYLRKRTGQEHGTHPVMVATYLCLFIAQHVFPQHPEPLQQSPAKAPTVIVSARTMAIKPEVIFFINNTPIRSLCFKMNGLAAQKSAPPETE